MFEYKRTKMNIGILFVLSCVNCISACNFSVTIKQELLMDGFHRNMTYDISIVAFVRDEVPTVWPYTDCYISLHQPLPSGIYANPDELDDLNRAHRLYALTKKNNVELPTHHAEPNMAYIFKKIRGPWLRSWLPLHARYHKAMRFGGYALNEIEEPTLYMRCPDKKLERCESPLAPVKFICTTRSSEKCVWKKVPYIISTETPILWRTPIGDLNHYYPVAIVTTMAVALGSIYLLLSINKSKYYMYDYEHID